MSSLNHTVDQMSDMKLHGMKDALLGQMEQPQYSSLTFEERLAHLIDAEVTDRSNRRIKRMLSVSKLKYKDAFIEEIDFHHSRGLDRKTILSLSNNDCVERHHNVIISGPTGTGKTYLACALANRAITDGYSAYYTRISHLLSQTALVRADGSYLSWATKLSRFKVLVLDDFGLSPLKSKESQEILEFIEDRVQRGSTIITSQLPISEWHGYFNNPTIADAIMDRLVHNAYKINLKGESMRKSKNVLS